MNIVIVDWSPMCAFPWYRHAVLNTRVAARYLAAFIEYLVSRGFRLSKIHLIGFSLGAEIAGFTGKNLKIGRLPRITGNVSRIIVVTVSRGQHLGVAHLSIISFIEHEKSTRDDIVMNRSRFKITIYIQERKI